MREPEAAPRAGTVTRRRFLRLGVGGAAVGAAGGLAGWWTGRGLPRVEHYSIELGDLPEGFHGFRILLLSDVHAGANMDERRMAELVEFVNARAADVIVVAGDMVDGTASVTDIRSFAEAFRHLSAVHGVVAVPGNHDHVAGIAAVSRELRCSGLRLLRGEHHVIRGPGGGLALLGVDDPNRDAFDPPQEDAVSAVASRAPAGLCPILVAHRPAAFEAAARCGIPLTLSGHTHGGQIALPMWSLTPVRLLTKYVRGHYRQDGSHLIVTSGVGTGILPFRAGVPPSVAVVTLRATSTDAPPHLRGASDTPQRGASCGPPM